MKNKFNEEEQSKRKGLVNSFWQETKNKNDDFVERQKNAFDFYKSVQWTVKEKEVLDSEGRPALTFNFIRPIIRNLAGYQRANKQDIKVFPRKDGVGKLADIFTEIIKAVYDGCNAVWEESFAFLYGCIGGKGWLSIDINYDDDPLTGDIEIINEDPTTVFEDPNCRAYDLNKDARYIWKTSWKIKDEIEKEYPDFKWDGFNPESMEADDRETFIDYGNKYKEGSTTKGADPSQFRYRVRQCQWKSWINKKFMVNVQTLEVTDLSDHDWKKKEVRAKVDEFLMADPNLKIVDRVIAVLNLTTMLGTNILDDIEDPFGGFNKFLTVRFCSDWTNGHAKGEVEDLMDPQREANKRYSQALHHLNRSANSGLVADSDAFGEANCSSWDEVEKFGTKGGMVYRKKKGAYLEQLHPMPLSEGHLRLARIGPDNMKRISGVNPDMLGEVSDPNMSGVAMEKRTSQGMVTTEIIHDNFRLTQKILGETLLDLIRKTDYISGEEVIAMVQEKNLMVNGQPITPDEVISLMRDRTKGKYGITVGLSQTAPTVKMKNFEILMDAVKNGFPIPPKVLIGNSALSEGDKEATLQYIEQQQQQQMAQNALPGTGGPVIPPKGV